MTPGNYRRLLVASVVLGIIASLLDMMFPSALPTVLVQAKEAEFKSWSNSFAQLMTTASLFLIALKLISVVGLYRFSSWAPRLALISTALGILLNIPIGVEISSGWAAFLTELSITSWGVVLTLSYFSPLKNRFARAGQYQHGKRLDAIQHTTTEELSYEEIERRFNRLISSPEDQIRWRRQWDDILETNNLSGQSPEQKHQAAQRAACRLLGLQENESNRILPVITELTDVLQGNLGSSEMAQTRRKNRLAGYSFVVFGSAGLGLACVFGNHPWLGGFCLAFALSMLGVVISLRSGRPAWVTELFMEYFW
jgi:hypothetical protein